MNLFLIGRAPTGAVDAGIAERALGELLAQLPFFDPGAIRTWRAPSGRAAAAWVAHDPERVGGVRYADADADGFALFSGRPFAWTGDTTADGRAPLDASFYRRPADEWAPSLDGRWCAARYDDGEGHLEIHSGPVGAYPVYRGDAGSVAWFSNSAAAIRTALRDDALDPVVMASVFASGFSITNQPIWRAVRRVDEVPPPAARAFDAGHAAALLTATTAALADWPGRPSVLQLSGGRDSRMVLAAALASGTEMTTTTGGPEDAPDMQIARALSDRAGIEHTAVTDPGDALWSQPQLAARVVGLSGAGAFSLEHASGHPLEPTSGPLPLWLNGQGGEVAGGYYGPSSNGPVAALLDHVATTRHLLSPAGRALVEGAIEEAIDGIASQDALDTFYRERRVGAWAAMGHGATEPSKGDTVSPLWSRRMLGDQLGAADRRQFTDDVLRELAPELAELPWADDQVVPQRTPRDLSAVVAATRAATDAQPGHAAWEVLDRAVVTETLDHGTDTFAIWRLATVFLLGQEAA